MPLSELSPPANQKGVARSQQVFLGGACGSTTWRKDIAIPILERAGVTYLDPQLGVGEWTPADEEAEMRAKFAAEVLMFVINEDTRGVASCAEVGYLIASGRPVALVLRDINAGANVNGEVLSAYQADDLNRGRIFVRTMAKQHGVPVFDNVADAAEYAVRLVKERTARLTIERVREILSNVACREYSFHAEQVQGGFHLSVEAIEADAYTAVPSLQRGRQWFIAETASPGEVVQTAFKAVLTWVEHEARESFRFKNQQVFGPHTDLEGLTAICAARPSQVE